MSYREQPTNDFVRIKIRRTLTEEYNNLYMILQLHLFTLKIKFYLYKQFVLLFC